MEGGVENDRERKEKERKIGKNKGVNGEPAASPVHPASPYVRRGPPHADSSKAYSSIDLGCGFQG